MQSFVCREGLSGFFIYMFLYGLWYQQDLARVVFGQPALEPR